MTTAKENRIWKKRTPNEESPNSFRSMELVGTTAYQISIKLFDIVKV